MKIIFNFLSFEKIWNLCWLQWDILVRCSVQSKLDSLETLRGTRELGNPPRKETEKMRDCFTHRPEVSRHSVTYCCIARYHVLLRIHSTYMPSAYECIHEYMSVVQVEIAIVALESSARDAFHSPDAEITILRRLLLPTWFTGVSTCAYVCVCARDICVSVASSEQSSFFYRRRDDTYYPRDISLKTSFVSLWRMTKRRW